jgi:hypothetical protein
LVFRQEEMVMAKTSWQISGDYFETCSCDYLCPCIPTNLAGRPTKGHCHFAMVFHIDQGRFGATALDGVSFAVLGYTPGVMAEGNWSVGLVVDEHASAAQREAIGSIATGQAGGPMAALGPLVGTILGVEAKPIRIERDGLKRSERSPRVRPRLG